jgi:hypothetical protein
MPFAQLVGPHKYQIHYLISARGHQTDDHDVEV